MKLLDTSKRLGNTKARKTNRDETIRMATLTMHPDNVVCAGAKAAGCMEDCLKDAGLGSVYPSINQARQARTDYWHNEQERFLVQLSRELENFSRLCAKQRVQGVVRLNVMSDISWEDYDVPQSFPELQFYDYTKKARRFHGQRQPDNYRLMFSYSGAKNYQSQVQSFLKSYSDAPMAVVFRNKNFPWTFMGREVINGDNSDWVNVNHRGVVVGLVAKGPAKTNTNGFVVDNDVIPTINF
tara:strand:- start:1839 stop:2558 length:720 start_codon:yes stop_codon:yes gene_type:complete